MTTLNDKKSEVDKIRPSVGKRGRKRGDLPEELIRKLHKDGLGSNAIATVLKRRCIEVSYKTIQRVLSRKR